MFDKELLKNAAKDAVLKRLKKGVTVNFNLNVQIKAYHVLLAGGAIGSVYYCTKLLGSYFHSKKKQEDQIDGVLNTLLPKDKKDTPLEDLTLPIYLEKEYGDFQELCFQTDPHISSYLSVFPESFFRSEESVFRFLTTLFDTQHKNECGRALVIGSKTGLLVLKLRRIFSEVIGIDSAFSKVVSCLQIINSRKVSYLFPSEGAYRVLRRERRLQKEKLKGSNFAHFGKRLEPVQFIHADFSQPMNAVLGKFNVVVVNDCLNDVQDPEALLLKLNRYVSPNSLLLIISDYMWKRTTNSDLGFGLEGVNTSFELLNVIFQDKFEFKKECNVPEVYGVSLRCCTFRNLHVTAWKKRSEKDDE